MSFALSTSCELWRDRELAELQASGIEAPSHGLRAPKSGKPRRNRQPLAARHLTASAVQRPCAVRTRSRDLEIETGRWPDLYRCRTDRCVKRFGVRSLRPLLKIAAHSTSPPSTLNRTSYTSCFWALRTVLSLRSDRHRRSDSERARLGSQSVCQSPISGRAVTCQCAGAGWCTDFDSACPAQGRAAGAIDSKGACPISCCVS